jgi:WD40 repeat protein
VGSRVWTYAWDRSIHIWNAKTRAPEFALPTKYHNDAISGIVAHWNRTHQCWQVISTSWDRSVIVWLARPDENDVVPPV